ncbi:hypothetical protein IWX91DRAFT_344002 [Phyllosticta citricarpa]
MEGVLLLGSSFITLLSMLDLTECRRVVVVVVFHSFYISNSRHCFLHSLPLLQRSRKTGMYPSTCSAHCLSPCKQSCAQK